MKSLVFWGVAPAVLAAVCGSAVSASADVVRVIAQANDTVTLDNGTTARIADFNLGTTTVTPLISRDGHVLFAANVRSTTVGDANGRTIWLANPPSADNPPGSLRLVARTQAPDPTDPGAVFSALVPPLLNDRGEAFFSAATSRAGASRRIGYWGYDGVALRPIAFQGLDTDTQLTLSSIANVQLPRDVQGGMLFRSQLGGTATSLNNQATWFVQDAPSAQNGLQLIARKGSPAIPTPTGQLSETESPLFGDVQVAMNSSGHAAVYSNLTGQGVRLRNVAWPNDQALWSTNLPGAGSSMSLIARAGDPAPGDGRRFHTLFNSYAVPQVNSAGGVVFAAMLADASGFAYDSGIWTSIGGSLRPVAIRGQEAPGTDSGVYFDSLCSVFPFRTSFACDSRDGGHGSVVFLAPLMGNGVSSANDRALFSYDSASGASRLLLRCGQQLPGAADGAVIAGRSFNSLLRVNRYGDVLTPVDLVGSSVTALNNRAIVTYVNGVLRTVARMGDVIPNSGGLTIGDIPAQMAILFNNRGQAVFGVGLKDVASAALIPAWLRVDEFGNLRLLTADGRAVEGQTGVSLAIGSTVVGWGALSDEGQFAFLASAGGAQYAPGWKVLSITIEPSQSQPPPPPPCPADINGDGLLTEQDIFGFLTSYFAGTGDFNHDGMVSTQDIFDFLAAWFRRC